VTPVALRRHSLLATFAAFSAWTLFLLALFLCCLLCLDSGCFGFRHVSSVPSGRFLIQSVAFFLVARRFLALFILADLHISILTPCHIDMMSDQ
jgi:hypothetical protein